MSCYNFFALQLALHYVFLFSLGKVRYVIHLISSRDFVDDLFAHETVPSIKSPHFMLASYKLTVLHLSFVYPLFSLSFRINLLALLKPSFPLQAIVINDCVSDGIKTGQNFS